MEMSDFISPTMVGILSVLAYFSFLIIFVLMMLIFAFTKKDIQIFKKQFTGLPLLGWGWIFIIIGLIVFVGGTGITAKKNKNDFQLQVESHYGITLSEQIDIPSEDKLFVVTENVILPDNTVADKMRIRYTGDNVITVEVSVNEGESSFVVLEPAD